MCKVGKEGGTFFAKIAAIAKIGSIHYESIGKGREDHHDGKLRNRTSCFIPYGTIGKVRSIDENDRFFATLPIDS